MRFFIVMNNKGTYLLAGLLMILSISTILILPIGNHVIAQSQSQTQNQSASQQGQRQPLFSADLTNQGLPGALQSNANASAKATFTLLPDAKTMSYTIKGHSQGKVADVALVFWTGGRSRDAAVIHSSTQQGLSKGTSGIVQGNITNANFVDVLQGKPMSELVKNILDGNVYVKVTTVDFPLGEMAGKVVLTP